MIKLDRRFAIIIGINDYDVSPLQYCVPDAQAVAAVLAERCGFKQEDIITIVSDHEHPIKDISGHLENAYQYIEREARPQTDSIFFYFAGHGEYNAKQSGMQFHDSLVEISAVFTRLNALELKYQCYVIDACESGGKVLTRGMGSGRFIEDFISNSSGILFMYAATENETATKHAALGHGLFTHYFLEAIGNTALYDEDGILTPNRIQDFIARETAKESKFKQNPVIENRTAGYYPFAFAAGAISAPEPAPSAALAVADEASRAAVAPTGLVDRLYFPTIPAAVREQVQAALKELLLQVLTRAAEEYRQAGYTVTMGENLEVFPTEADDKVTGSIVERANSQSMEAVNQLFSTEQRSNRTNQLRSLGSGWLDSFMHSSQPTTSTYSYIRWHDDNIAAYSLYLQSNDVRKVSGGLVVVVYQAVYGVCMANSSFFREFTGYEEAQANGVSTSIKAFKVHEQTLPNMEQGILAALTTFKSKLAKWNTTRQQKIDEFGNKAE
jgi:uncharacterized caspase-like protein